MRLSAARLLLLVCCAPLAVLVGVVLADAPAPPPALSKLMPADDLIAEIDQCVTSCRDGIMDAQSYADKSRQVKRDAHTIAALALTLAKHDQDHRLKSSAPALLAAAQQLAAAADYDAAKKSFANVESAAAGKSPGAARAAEWGKVAGLGQLMKQVTFVNNRLKRNMRRFEERKNDNARDAATLAAIAQACNYDTHEVKEASDLDKWYQLCGEMRDAAGSLNAQIHAGDKAGAETALGNLGKSCETCHETFRVRTAP
ncbi:MAG TPA: cytochrome c [Pirellulales bacterium]|nr:cytochrome c [Pirellulales bacterium]